VEGELRGGSRVHGGGPELKCSRAAMSATSSGQDDRTTAINVIEIDIGTGTVERRQLGHWALRRRGWRSNPSPCSAVKFRSYTSPGEKREPLSNLSKVCFSEADQELATMLREVCINSDAALGSTPQSQPTSELLMCAVACAVKQHMLRAEVSNLALTDELTGLYNRRGFLALAERQLKLGQRTDREMLLFFIDVDNLKRINDSFGHSEGDRALIRTAEVLGKTFRDSDVLARLGGDEFAALAIEASGHSEAVVRARIRQNLDAVSRRESRYHLAFSLGAVRFDSRTASSIAQLMSQADRAMYEHKTEQRRMGRVEALFAGTMSRILRADAE
jgi:diguanylate cyclase (GGDEF)-like protein